MMGLRSQFTRRGALTQCGQAVVFILLCVCCHCATEQEYSVPLKRQEIPLYSKGGAVHHKSAYYGTLQVGGPTSQKFEVVFDTGSGHLVLPSTMCPSPTCRNHRRYRRKGSLISQDIDVDGTLVDPSQPRDQITVSFGTGQITGVFMNDQVCLGEDKPMEDMDKTRMASLLQTTHVVQATPDNTGTVERTSAPVEEDESTDSMKASAPKPMTEAESWRLISQKHRRIGCIDLRLVATTEMSDEPFSSFVFDGILGLGLTGLSQTTHHNFFDVLPNGLPGKMAMMGVFLAVSDKEESQVTFGSYRDAHLLRPEEGIHWSKLQDPEHGYWQIDVLGITANGQKVDYCNEGCRAVVDTGTSLLAVPSKLGPQLRKLLKHPAAEDGSCGYPGGPKLELHLENFTIVLDPLDIARPEFLRKKKPVAAVESAPAASVTPVASEPASENTTASAMICTERSMGKTAHQDGVSAWRSQAANSADCGSTGAPEASSATGVVAEVENAAISIWRGLIGDAAQRTEVPRSKCVAMLMHIDLPEPLSQRTLILGEPVLQRYYTVFDRSNLRVGFGEASHVQPRQVRRQLEPLDE